MMGFDSGVDFYQFVVTPILTVIILSGIFIAVNKEDWASKRKKDEQLIISYLLTTKEKVLIKSSGVFFKNYDVTYDGKRFLVVIEDNKITKFVQC